ncbi:ribonuclease H-like domain-containing protein [Blautia producta]|uniref:ribonuclease H-like domain-containing protein n=1 Tax=Blautia producta TaxID=33035 RepID=UPI0031B5ACC9
MLTNKIFNYQFMPEYAKLFLPSDIQEEDILFFDIETTGLSHRNSRVYLIGAALCAEGKWEMIQFLAQKEDEEEERAVLEAFQSLCAQKRCFVHFNGSTFDIPYLQHKYQSCRLTAPFTDAVSIDLYRILQPFRPLLQTPNFRQKSLEPLAGYKRQDTMDGKELIKVYRTYAKTGQESLLKLLFLHNHDDVEGMGRLLAFGAILALFRGEFRVHSVLAVTDKAMDGSLLQEVLFTVKLPLSFPVPLSFSLPCAYVTLEKDCCKMKMPLLEGTLKYYYADYKNYYYLPLEDEAVHKSVGVYVDPSCREKAKASNCCKRVSGYFLRAFGTPCMPVLKESYESGDSYIQWTDSFLQNQEMQKSYLLEYLKSQVHI